MSTDITNPASSVGTPLTTAGAEPTAPGLGTAPGSSGAPGTKVSLTGRKARHRLLVHGIQAAALVIYLGVWEAIARAKILDPLLWGQPSGVWNQLITWITQGTSIGSLGTQVWVTMEEALIGFVIGTVLGIVLGIALGRINFLSEVFGPFIKVLNSIPRIVLGSIFVIIFGLGLESKIMLVIVLVFFGVFFNAFQGTREADKNFIANAAILGASKWQITRKVVLPSAFVWITASLHIAFGFAIIGAIVGEFIGSSAGLGYLIKQAQGNFNTNGVLAAMIVIGVIALVAEWLIGLLENRLLRWRPKQNTSNVAAGL